MTDTEIEFLIRKATTREDVKDVHPYFRVNGTALVVHDVERDTFYRALRIIRTKFSRLQIRCEHTYFRGARYTARGLLMARNRSPLESMIGDRLSASIMATLNEKFLCPSARDLLGHNFATTKGPEHVEFFNRPDKPDRKQKYQSFFEPDGRIRFISENHLPAIIIDVMVNERLDGVRERAESYFRCSDEAVRLVVIINIRCFLAGQGRMASMCFNKAGRQYLAMLQVPGDDSLRPFDTVTVSVLDREESTDARWLSRWLVRDAQLSPDPKPVRVGLSWHHVMKKTWGQYLSEREVEDPDGRWQEYRPLCDIDFEDVTQYLSTRRNADW